MSKIRLSVFYPNTEGAKFDHDYYKNTHVPLCLDVWGLDGSAAEIDKGIDGPFTAAVHFTFDSLETMGAAMGSERMGEIMADVANYTDLTPQMQTSEITG